MAISRRELIAFGTAGAVTALTPSSAAAREEKKQDRLQAVAFSEQIPTDRPPGKLDGLPNLHGYDVRNDLTPRR